MTRIIDIHPHIIAADTQRYPIIPLGGKRSEWSETRPKTFEQLVAGMDEAGINKAAIVHSVTTYGYDNSYCADIVSAHPGRFTGVGTVDLMADDAVEKIRHWHGRGITGLRHITAITTQGTQTDWLAHPKTFPAWEAVQAMGMTLCVQMRRHAAPQLEQAIQRFPKLRIVGEHLIGAPIEEGPPYSDCQYLWDLARHDNFYLKLTTNNVRKAKTGKASPETFFPELVKRFPASRIAWGSNFPASDGTLKFIVDEARSALCSLSQADQDWIFSRTAQILYPALADTV